MTVRAASPAIHVVRDFDTGAVAAQRAESRKAVKGSSLSARCKRLEENMLTNLSSLQTHRRGLETVVQNRKEKAEKSAQELRLQMKELMHSSTGNGSILGIAPLNFQTLRDRTATLDENVNSNYSVILSNRSILNSIQGAKQEGQHAEDITKLAEERIKNDDDSLIADKCRSIEEDARRIGANLHDGAEIEDAIQVERRETRQYLLFGIPPSRPNVSTTTTSTSRHHQSRPLSAPAVASQSRPLSAPAVASRTSTTRPPSVLSQRPASALSRNSRPTSANSITARIKLMEANVCENKKVMDTNKDGLEVVKKRREAAAKAMADCLAALTSANSANS